MEELHVALREGVVLRELKELSYMEIDVNATRPFPGRQPGRVFI
jgi:hypothetical protein